MRNAKWKLELEAKSLELGGARTVRNKLSAQSSQLKALSLLFSLVFASALCAGADPAATNAASVLAATLRDDGSTNTWTQTDLTDALGLMNRKYWRDMESPSGRAQWHGKIVESHLETNETTRVIQRVDQYADGFVWREKGSKRRALTPEEAADLAARRRNARQMRIDFLRENIERLLVEGAAPATNDEQIAAAAMARINARKYQRQLDRLLAQQSTNSVDVVVTPQTPNP